MFSPRITSKRQVKESKVKIAIVCPRYPPAIGGAEKYLEAIAVGLSKRGFCVEVFTSDYEQHLNFVKLDEKIPREENKNGVKIFRLSSFPWKRYGYFITPQVVPHILSSKPDVLYAAGFGYWSCLAAYICGRILHKPLVIQPNFAVPYSPFQKAYQRTIGKLLREANGAVFYSEFEKKLMGRYGKIPRNSIVASPGVDESFFSISHNRDMLSKLGLHDKRVVLAVGRIDDGKRIDLIIKVTARLRKLFPEIALVVAGPDFGAVESLKALAHQLAVADCVYFAGRLEQDDLIALYRQAEVFVHPSGFELFGIVVAEAFASSLPVVASNTGSLPELVEHGETGLLFKEGSEEELFQAIKLVLEDKVLARKLAEQAHKKALREYRWEKTVDKVERLIKNWEKTF